MCMALNAPIPLGKPDAAAVKRAHIIYTPLGGTQIVVGKVVCRNPKNKSLCVLTHCGTMSTIAGLRPRRGTQAVNEGRL